MSGRQDALTAAAEAVLLVERRCTGEVGLVGTVGKIEALPGAANVIPGQAGFSLDIRAETDPVREAAVAEVVAGIRAIAERRGLRAEIVTYDEHPSSPCNEWLIAQFEQAIADEGLEPLRLPSGAGHDAMTVAEIADVGMIFVRCAGGISHNPAEAITAEDAELGARALLRFIRNFQPERDT
jgi:allantoate deiminase